MWAPEWVPNYSEVQNLVYSADGRHVETVYINGRLVMDDRKVLTVDENEVIAHCASPATSCSFAPASSRPDAGRSTDPKAAKQRPRKRKRIRREPEGAACVCLTELTDTRRCSPRRLRSWRWR